MRQLDRSQNTVGRRKNNLGIDRGVAGMALRLRAESKIGQGGVTETGGRGERKFRGASGRLEFGLLPAATMGEEGS